MGLDFNKLVEKQFFDIIATSICIIALPIVAYNLVNANRRISLSPQIRIHIAVLSVFLAFTICKFNMLVDQNSY